MYKKGLQQMRSFVTVLFAWEGIFLERLFEWEFWWVEGNRATAGKNKGSSRFFVG